MTKNNSFSFELKRGIEHLKNNDPKLARVIEMSPVCSIRRSSKHLELLASSIISQQLSGKVADTIYGRMNDHFKGKLTTPGILSTDETVFRSFGLSFAKIACLKDLAQKIENGEIKFSSIIKKSSEDLITDLTKVKGIGEWTAQMYLMFGLARLDILPVKDFGIRKAIMKLYSLRKMPDERKVNTISMKNNWAPYRTIASWYLWRSLDQSEND